MNDVRGSLNVVLTTWRMKSLFNCWLKGGGPFTCSVFIVSTKQLLLIL